MNDGGVEHNRFAQQLFAPLPARYDRLAELLSLGQNARWRRAMIDRVAAARPGRVLDVATGTAGVALQLARRTGASVVGLDLSGDMLRRAADRVADAPGQIALVAGRAEELPFAAGSFDALTFTYLLRYVADPEATLGELARVVRPGGVMASLEFHRPDQPVWHAMWWAYTRALLPLGGLVTGGVPWFRVGTFLGPSISDHDRLFPLGRLVRAWERAGFVDVGHRVMSLGGGLVMWGTRSSG
ncbi:MAG TPA: class I SAM-dependent methyltransferase [Acidimicrobiales bacterium]|nr:class I SAM-dependent methyltransferase [Acidimicrobiales bacterium]